LVNSPAAAVGLGDVRVELQCGVDRRQQAAEEGLVVGRSNRQVAASLGISNGAASGAAGRARTLGLDWAQITALSDDALEERLYGPRTAKRVGRPLPDPAFLHLELRRVGVTLQLLHLEYLEQHPNGFRYTAFCGHYSAWHARQKLTMRQVHRAGEKLFVDYSGNKPRIVDPQTGEVTEVELFVAVLGASNFTYAEATRTQTIPDWIGSHVRALHDIGGVPKVIVARPAQERGHGVVPIRAGRAAHLRGDGVPTTARRSCRRAREARARRRTSRWAS
jgi:transposase